jgi:hypothetical protein
MWFGVWKELNTNSSKFFATILRSPSLSITIPTNVTTMTIDTRDDGHLYWMTQVNSLCYWNLNLLTSYRWPWQHDDGLGYDDDPQLTPLAQWLISHQQRTTKGVVEEVGEAVIRLNGLNLKPRCVAPKSSVYALATDPFGRIIASGSPERVICYGILVLAKEQVWPCNSSYSGSEVNGSMGLERGGTWPLCILVE